MERVYELLRTVGPSTASVLLVGESGTGKELAARTLHELSGRRARRFVAVNCGAIPESLIESELFGHEKGAYTGATSRRAGHFELADGGTLFLDELGAMPLASQVKLLRALEEKAIRRLRGAEEIGVDVRVIAAMNEDPLTAVREGRLREDLYYRVNVFAVTMPPLRERREDIVPLAEHFVHLYAEANGKRIAGLGGEVARKLEEHTWPGNVRELRNAMEHAVIVAEGDHLRVPDLPPTILRTAAERPRPTRDPSGNGSPDSHPDVGFTLEESTRWLVLRTVQASGFNKSRAARVLGVSSKTVYNKLREWSREGDPLARSVEARCRDERASRRGADELPREQPPRVVRIADGTHGFESSRLSWSPAAP